MRKIKLTLAIASAFFAGALFAFAQTAKKTPGKETIAVVKIVPENALLKMKSNEEIKSMSLAGESLFPLIVSSLQKTRKFEILTRNNLDAAIGEIDFAESGNVDGADKSAQAGKFKAAKYTVAVRIYDFQDLVEEKRFASLNKTVRSRDLRFKVVADIVETSTGAIKESQRFSTKQAKTASKTGVTAEQTDGELLGILSEEVADQIALFVSDIIFPAKVIGKTGNVVTINKGAGMDIAAGQIWEVFALGEEMIDEDTGESYGAEEIFIGKISITDVLPKFSKGKVLEDNGIEHGQIVRPKKQEPAAPEK